LAHGCTVELYLWFLGLRELVGLQAEHEHEQAEHQQATASFSTRASFSASKRGLDSKEEGAGARGAFRARKSKEEGP